MKVCRIPGCPTLIPADSYRGLCDEHRKQHNRDRGSSTTRGYDAAYKRERAAWKTRILAGETIPCWRCDKPVTIDFHLGHDDHDRTVIRGPEHPACNLRAAGQARHN